MFHEIAYKDIRLYMIEQPWIPEEVDFALDTLHLYPQLPVLVDPYNPEISYHGPRDRITLSQIKASETIRPVNTGRFTENVRN